MKAAALTINSTKFKISWIRLKYILVPGDEFALHGDGIYCKDDHELFERVEDNNNHDPKHSRIIKTECEDFRDNLSDIGREDDSYR